jgi:hypothetical protein
MGFPAEAGRGARIAALAAMASNSTDQSFADPGTIRV